MIKFITLVNMIFLKYWLQFIQKYKLTLGGLITVVGSDGKPTQVSASSLGQLGGAIAGASDSGLGGAGIYIFLKITILMISKNCY